MSEEKPYPKNVPGDFIVNDGECIQCCSPEAEAPDLMGNDGRSCYFKKQPSTREELERAINAVSVSCVGAVRYVGNDVEVLKRIAKSEEEGRKQLEADLLKSRTVGDQSRRDELMEVAWDVARKFIGYESYGSRAKARKALQRRCRGFREEEYSVALDEAISLLDEAVEIVARNTEMLRKQWEAQHWEPKHIDYEEIDIELHQEYPQFPIPVCQLALDWAFYWYHLR